MGLGLNVHRLGDVCTGHDCFPPRASTEGSPDVRINGIPAHRLGDAWDSHCCPDKGCHTSKLALGSTSVKVNGLSLGRAGDLIECGSFASSSQCSPDVFSGG